MDHDIERCLRVRQECQQRILEKLRARMDLLREEMRRVVELTEYVEDIASSEGNIRSIFEDTTGRMSSVIVNYNPLHSSPSKNKDES